MTATQKFSTEGRENGFPFCITKVNVSAYDHWVTLAGVSKTSPTTSSSLIGESFEKACKIFWNLYGANIDMDMTAYYWNMAVLSEDLQLTNTQFDGQTVNPSGISDTPFSSITNDDQEPKERVCLPNDSTDPLDYFTVSEGMDCRNIVVSTTAGTQLSPSQRAALVLDIKNLGHNNDNLPSEENGIIAMYNGVTNDPDNLVGYGIGNINISSGCCGGCGFGGIQTFINMIALGSGWNTHLNVSLFSYGNESDLPSKLDARYVELPTGENFVLYSSTPASAISHTVSVTVGSTIDVDFTGPSDHPNPPDTLGTFSITGLEYYTY
jgi:hypothetical protein